METVLRGPKGGGWLGRGPMHHRTGGKIRIHACYCMPGISLPQATHKQSQSVWPGLFLKQPGDKGQPRQITPVRGGAAVDSR
jgi:hypothetical protein